MRRFAGHRGVPRGSGGLHGVRTRSTGASGSSTTSRATSAWTRTSCVNASPSTWTRSTFGRNSSRSCGMKQPLNALIVKEGEGEQDAVPIGDGIFMSRGISNSYLGHHERRRPADQYRHVLRGAADQGAVRQGQQWSAPGHRLHAGSPRPRRRLVAVRCARVSRPSSRPITPTFGSTSAGSSRASHDAPASSGAATSPTWTGPIQPPEPVPTTTFLGQSCSSTSAAVASSCTRRLAARRPTHTLCGFRRSERSSRAI